MTGALSYDDLARIGSGGGLDEAEAQVRRRPVSILHVTVNFDDYGVSICALFGLVRSTVFGYNFFGCCIATDSHAPFRMACHRRAILQLLCAHRNGR